MNAAADPGRAAYEARFAHARPRDVEPWDSLTPEAKAIWARVEAACRDTAETGQGDAPIFDEALAYLRPPTGADSADPVTLNAGMLRCCVSAILMRAGDLVASADRWGSEYADAMDARMADAITMERVGSALAVFARMNAMDPPEGVRLNDWLPAVTAARAALKEAGLQRLLDLASGTPESEARSRA